MFLLAPAIGSPEEELVSLSLRLHAEDRMFHSLEKTSEHCFSEKDGMVHYLRQPNRLPILFPNKDDYGAQWHSSQ